MSLNDSSALILIVGALAVLAFVIHGLWFSSRAANRKLTNNKIDQELSKSSSIGKVRIVIQDKKLADPHGIGSMETFEHTSSNTSAMSFTVEPSTPEPVIASEEPEETYEINLIADKERPYLGTDVEELCNSCGILRGENDLYYVYENQDTKDKVVFRICSLERPYSFPKDMSNFKTGSLAMYMYLPPKGRASPYFKAMRNCSNIFIDRLGGRLQDNDYRDFTQESLDKIASILQRYDDLQAEQW